MGFVESGFSLDNGTEVGKLHIVTPKHISHIASRKSHGMGTGALQPVCCTINHSFYSRLSPLLFPESPLVL